MTMTPRLSVIVSIYNGQTTLDRCLTSIQNQTYPATAIEVIAINDGSTDTTADILTTWQQKVGPANFKIITNPQNLGLTRSLNIGLQGATGEYIARIDADDTWLATKTTDQITWLTAQPDYGLIGGWYVNRTTQGRRVIQVPETDQAIRRSIFKRNPFGHSCILAKRDLVIGVGGYDETIKFGQDYDLWFRLLPKTKFYNLPRVVCEREHTRGLSFQYGPQQMAQSYRTILKYLRLYQAPVSQYTALLIPALAWFSAVAKSQLRIITPGR